MQLPEPHSHMIGDIAAPEAATLPPAAAESRAGRRAPVIATLLCLGAFGVVLANLSSSVYDLERFIVPKELVLHAAALAALVVMAPGWRRIEAGVVELLLAGLVLWSALSALLAVNRWLSLRALGVTFSAFVVFLGARRVARDGLGWVVVQGLGAAAAVGGLLGIAQAYGAEWSWLADSRPPGGTFGNRNFLSHLMAIAMPLFMFLALRGRRAGALLGYGGLLIAVSAVVLTRSRAGWLGMAFGVGVTLMALLAQRRTMLAGARRRRAVAALALMAVGVCVAVFVPNRLEWRSASPYAETLTRIASFSEGSGRGRLIQYGHTLKLAAENPVFGVGPGNWFVHYPRVTERGDPSFSGGDPIPTNPWPSSDWVGLVAERGGIAVLLALLAGCAAVIVAVRRLASADPDVAAGCAALLGVLGAAWVTGVFDAVLMLAPPALFVAAAAGALLPRTRSVVDGPFEGRFRRGAGIAAVALAFVLVATSTAQLLAIRSASGTETRANYERASRLYPGDHRLHLLLARSGRCAARIPHARAAAKLMPFHDAPRRALAACGVRE